jgi:hypothetical protein
MRLNPFNPQLPARSEIFVGREPEIRTFERYLTQTMGGSPMNMSIAGNRGMGKSSILVKFEDMAKREDCLVISLSNRESKVADVEGLSGMILDALRREIVFNRTLGMEVQAIKDLLISLKPTMSYEGLEFAVERKNMEEQFLRDALLQIWGKVEGRFSACVILIDEAESLERVDGGLEFLREVFQRLGQQARFMIVLAGKLTFPERMSESFSPLNRFFPVSHLQPFTRSETDDFILKQLGKVNMEAESGALDEIYTMTEGHPYVLVASCFAIFDSLPLATKRIEMNDVLACKDRVLKTLGQDFFAAMYHPLTPKAKEVLEMILPHCPDGSFSFSQAVDWTGMENSSISPYLLEMTRKGILNKRSRGQYEIFHILFAEYILRMDELPRRMNREIR